MATVNATRLATAILVNNVHCTSCVSYIEELLHPYRDAIIELNISVMSGEVRVVHHSSLVAEQICKALDNGAFEVHSATSSNDLGQEIFRISPGAGQSCVRQRSASSMGEEAGCFRVPKRNLHAEKCEACQKEMETASESSFRRLETEHGDIDLEKAVAGDLRAATGPPSFKSMSSAGNQKLLGMRRSCSGSQKRKLIMSIGGMTCSSCTSAIDRALRDLPFVDNIEVSLMTNSATVILDDSANIDKILDTVDDLGYECSLQTNEPDQPTQDATGELPGCRRTVTLKVDGMFCKHCPDNLIGSLKRTWGSTVTIDKPPTLTDPTFTITYISDPPNFTLRDIIPALDKSHEAFRVTPYHPPSVEERSQAMQRREQFKLLVKLAISFLVAIPTFLIGVVWMTLVPSEDSIRMFFDRPLWSGNAPRRDWALLILATVTMFCAADVFHVRAIKEIRSLWRRGSRVPLLRRFIRFGSMNLLVSAGTSVAYFSSIAMLAMEANSKPEEMGHSSMTYFDSVVFLTFFVLIGRWLEVYSKAKTGNAVAMLGNLKPSDAILVTSSNRSSTSSEGSTSLAKQPSGQTPPNATALVDADLLEVGDVVLVRHGSSPPTDGEVFAGTTKFNESSLTGEAKPVPKNIGEKVIAGAINVGDAIQVKVMQTGGTSMLDQIVSVVREGQTKRAPVERVVDVVTGYFVPAITTLAILTWVIWLALGQSGSLSEKYLGDSQQGGWPFWSLEFAIAVFVVACPCGIGLAAPTALFVGSGLAAKHGILVRGGGEAFQEASSIDAVVFDKTGTLTEGGDLSVTDHEMLAEGEEADISWAATRSLEEASTHPLARAIYNFASDQAATTTLQTESISEEAGKGLRSHFTSGNTHYEAALGSEAFISSLIPKPDFTYFPATSLSKWKNEAKSVAVLALRNTSTSATNTSSSSDSPWRITLLFAISDPIRPSTIPTLRALQARNIPTYMLTGDNATTAAAVASTLSIPIDHVFAGVLPTEKAEKIHWLQSHLASPNKTNRKKGGKATVAFIGDGTNDAPALSAASVSIAIAHPNASDIALTSASFIVLSNRTANKSSAAPEPDLSGFMSGDSEGIAPIITLLDLSTRVFNRVKFNFAWACVYNAVLVPVAAGVLFRVKEDGWRLGPVWGSAAMALSSVSVVVSSAMLRWEGGWKDVVRWQKGGR